MVVQMAIPLTYVPLLEGGFNRITASRSELIFSRSFSFPKLIFPTGTWRLPALSTLNSTLPAFHLFYSFGNIKGNGAYLRVWHKPSGTQNLTKFTDHAHHIGCCNGLIKIQSILSGSSQSGLLRRPNQHRLPAASFSFCPFAKTSTLTFLPKSVGQRNAAPHHLVRMSRINTKPEAQLPRFHQILHMSPAARRSRASSISYRLFPIYFVSCFAYFLPNRCHYITPYILTS